MNHGLNQCSCGGYLRPVAPSTGVCRSCQGVAPLPSGNALVQNHGNSLEMLIPALYDNLGQY